MSADVEFIPRGTLVYEVTRVHLAGRVLGFTLRRLARDLILGAVVRGAPPRSVPVVVR